MEAIDKRRLGRRFAALLRGRAVIVLGIPDIDDGFYARNLLKK
jgi:predicted protein tyrosine phosphatase